jgi:hypothetical protein
MLSLVESIVGPGSDGRGDGGEVREDGKFGFVEVPPGRGLDPPSASA